LFPNKKGTKEIGIGEALIASQNAPSPKNPSRYLRTNTKPQNEGGNVPIFALPITSAVTAMRRGIAKGALFARSAPLPGFFWYFSCRDKKST